MQNHLSKRRKKQQSNLATLTSIELTLLLSKNTTCTQNISHQVMIDFYHFIILF
ncbi:uncharacterized protein DS421_1g11330 [Arachis hypogaea]|nr:uncharacterized protein DS421_1g11330 [Arachis hypogaea]